MDDLLDILEIAEGLHRGLDMLNKEFLNKFRIHLHGPTTLESRPITTNVENFKGCLTPQQKHKRARKLSSMNDTEDQTITCDKNDDITASNNETYNAISEHEFARPQRAAKLKSEKLLKEPKLNKKLRRPSNCSKDSIIGIHIKEERESIGSSFATETSIQKEHSIEKSTSNDHDKQTKNVTEIFDAVSENKKTNLGSFCVKIKREKLSISDKEETPSANEKKQTDTSLTYSEDKAALPNNVSKKVSKKRDGHKPIKIERFSDLDKIDKKDSVESKSLCSVDGPENLNAKKNTEAKNEGENLHTAPSQISNESSKKVLEEETCTNKIHTNTEIGLNDDHFDVEKSNKNSSDNQKTYVIPNETFQIIDANVTFNVSPVEPQGKQIEYALPPNSITLQTKANESKNSYQSKGTQNTDETLQQKSSKLLAKHISPKKLSKMVTRNELFNPFVQSPVKEKVEAFEIIAKAASSGKDKFAKLKDTPKEKNPSNTSTNTPTAEKIHFKPTLNRFLTPTQAINIKNNPVQVKKLASSTSKIQTFAKTTSFLKSNLQSTKMGISRENSMQDFRAGLNHLAEERKKQRDQKQMIAAQHREIKEKERTERIAKLAKEREEKLLKKQLEADQKKKTLDEVQRKLKQQETYEGSKQKIHNINPKELDQNQMKPPNTKKVVSQNAKLRIKYNFEMLHEDDSTDDEEKVTYKRPTPPDWSQKKNRGYSVHVQQHFLSTVIDNFFSVEPLSPDLGKIFPSIDERHLKRNSSVFWSTPPRYSELPKY